MTPAVRQSILFGNPSRHSFRVEGFGIVPTLPLLATILNANPSANVVMLNDYDATKDGVFSATPITTPYTGTFDGQQHTIRNFQLVDASNSPGLDDGLFARVGDNVGAGTVKNLTISGSITQTSWERTTFDSAGRFLLGTTMGGLAAFNSGTVDNCTSLMTIVGGGSGGQYGGLVGRNLAWSGKIISNITQANPGVVTTTTAHGYSTGQQLYVIAGSVAMVGMNQLYNQLLTITVLSSTTFSIGVDTTGYTAYTSGGETTLGAGTIKNCSSSAVSSILRENYNSYLSSLCGSNYGLINNCVVAASASATCPGNYADTPPTAQYAAGWVGTASISGTTMTVSATSTGTMAVGLYLYVPNELPGNTLPSGINVVADLGGGTWQVSTSVTMTSRDLKAATGAPGTFPTVGAWTGGISADCGLPAIGRSPSAVISNCKSFATILSSNNTNSGNYAGGIAAFVGDGNITNCITYGSTTGANSLGGIFGQMGLSSGVVRDCISFGSVSSQRDVSGNYGASIGGIGGQVYGTVTDCETYSNVLGGDTLGGGLGLVRGTAVITRLVAFGTVTGGINTGGAANTGAGGLIGQTISGSVIDQAVCTGVTIASTNTGACVGTLAAGSTFSNTYFDIDSTGRASGIGSGSSAGITGITDAALLAALPSGFDGSWSRAANQSSFYPYVNTLPLSALAGGVLPAPIIVLNPPLSLSFVGVGTSIDSATVTMPAGIQAGDYCWLFGSSQNTSTSIPALVTPAGFTFLQQATSAATHGVRTATHFKVLDGTETTITGMGAGTRATFKYLMVFRPSNLTGDVWTRLNPKIANNGAGTGVATQTMGAGTSPCFIVAASITDGGTNPTPIITTGDNESFALTSGITATVVAKASYRINNTGAAAANATADTVTGSAIACVNVSVS